MLNPIFINLLCRPSGDVAFLDFCLVKFLPFEQEGIQEAIRASQHAQSDISFVKRKGRMRIQRAGCPDFVYFRRHETQLNAEKRWVEIEYFLLESVEPTVKLNSWDELMQYFSKWLEE